MNLAMSVVMAGANFWDAATHVMSGSNDLPTRKRIFGGSTSRADALRAAEAHPPDRRGDFSQSTRNHFRTFPALLSGHADPADADAPEFQIVTPRTLAAFRGST